MWNQKNIPRGVAAVPLLCAAASESFESYKIRVFHNRSIINNNNNNNNNSSSNSNNNDASSSNSSSNNWWRQQEPLCADPGTPLAFPEHLVLGIARKMEDWMYTYMNTTLVAASFPLHNVLIAIWILFIYICTFVGSATIVTKTVLLGPQRVGAGSIQDLFQQTILPLGASTLTLTHPRQALSVRTIGMLLMPLRYICQISTNIADSSNAMVLGASFYIWSGVMTWFYWLSFLPWASVGMIWVSFMISACYAVIQVAEVL
jgi:hypothetical protein